MRRIAAIALACALLASTAAPAGPKEGVRAVAEGTVRMATSPGERMRVTWRLQDAEGIPFGAGGIYLRVARCGRSPLLVPARELAVGRYTARFRVPRRMRKLTVGLEGWRSFPGGRTERADAMFEFAPVLKRRCG